MNYKPRKKLMKYKETNKAALKIDYANLSILKSF
jgi:ribosomal protein S18